MKPIQVQQGGLLNFSPSEMREISDQRLFQLFKYTSLFFRSSSDKCKFETQPTSIMRMTMRIQPGIHNGSIVGSSSGGFNAGTCWSPLKLTEMASIEEHIISCCMGILQKLLKQAVT